MIRGTFSLLNGKLQRQREKISSRYSCDCEKNVKVVSKTEESLKN